MDAKKERRVINTSFKKTKTDTWLWNYVCEKTEGEDISEWMKAMLKIAIKNIESGNEKYDDMPF